MVKIEINILKPNQYRDWDSFIENSHEGTIYHYSDWLKISSQYKNYDLKIFGFYIDDELIGGCPLYFSKKYMLFGNTTTSSPTTQYNGFVFNVNQYDLLTQFTIKNKIYDNLLKEIPIGVLDSISIVNSPSFNDTRYFAWNGWNTVIQYAFFIDLQSYKDSSLVNRMEKKITENHLTIEESGDIDSFFTLYESTWNRRGYEVPINKEFIQEIFHVFERKNKIKMFFGVSKSGKIAGAMIVLIDPNCVHTWVAATDSELWKTGILYGMYSHIIHYYKNEGHTLLNIHMANTKSLLSFAYCFNPRLVPFLMIEKKGIINKALSKGVSFSQKNWDTF